MKKNFFFNSLLFCSIILLSRANAQSIDTTDEHAALKIATLPYYSYGKGLGMTSPDSLYQLNIRFRMQSRLTYNQSEQQEPVIDGQIRRLRLRFDGYVGNPKFTYAIQLSFSPGDIGVLQDKENINIIRDAVVFYNPNKKWSIGFGQTKLPGNRQRVNSSGALQLTDRTINNAQFNIDRDFGLQVHQINQFKNEFSYNFKGAISIGEGRNWTKNTDAGLAYTGRVELMPLGAFTKGGEYFEGDIMREKRPKVMLSGTYHFNNNAKRMQGQTGNELFEQRNLSSLLLDFIFKYKGFAFMSAYMNRVSDNPITHLPANPVDMRYVFVGQGVDFQASYNFAQNLDVIGRYSIQNVHQDIHLYAPHARQMALGITKYIWEHAFKLQAEVGYDTKLFHNNDLKNSWYTRLQIEMGI